MTRLQHNEFARKATRAAKTRYPMPLGARFDEAEAESRQSADGLLENNHLGAALI